MAGNLEPVTALALDMIKEGGQVLIFANTRRNAVSIAKKVSNPIYLAATDDQKADFARMSQDFMAISDPELEITKDLHDLIKNGVAFHHAGLANKQLDFIVDQFNHHKIKVICATPTLAAGVNTPARRVIIQSLYRYGRKRKFTNFRDGI